MHLHLLRVTQTQVGASNHCYSCCQRHECEDFQPIRSARTHIQRGKPSHSTVARTSGQMLYVCVFTQRPMMTFAAAIIHFGTFYPGSGKVLLVEDNDLHGSRNLKRVGTM